MSKLTVLLLLSALGLGFATASAEIIDPELSVPMTANPGAVLYNRIDGEGFAFTQGHMSNGMVVDATITLTAINYLGDPLPNFPAEDLWLETTEGGLAFPPAGTIADAPTDANGQTMWQQPLVAGGCTIGESVVVMALGVALNTTVDVQFVSPDMNGDLDMNLSDVSLFSTAYMAGYTACGDLFHDGDINLTDLSLFAQGYGI